MNCSDKIRSSYNAIIFILGKIIKRSRSLKNPVSALTYTRFETLDSTGEQRN